MPPYHMRRPGRKPYNFKKTYTLSTTQEVHEQIQKLAKDTGTTQMEIATILLTTALASLKGNLKQEIVERRINEAQARLNWLNRVKNIVTNDSTKNIDKVDLRHIQ